MYSHPAAHNQNQYGLFEPKISFPEKVYCEDL